jgi:exopolyphosphatase / guanosine-5'-triphosphate,3'-diphosphate pyrophosphatase
MTVRGPVATIDIGTNTTLLLIAHASPDDGVEVLAERAEITRLGRGIGSTGELGAAGIAATLDVLRAYAQLAQVHGARIAAIGTEALRRAPNAATFLGPAAAILATEVEVIDGTREAALTFRAVLESFPRQVSAQAPLVVVDIGGGSTEIIVAERGQVRLRTSLPLGSVRLTETHVKHDPALPAEIAAVRAAIAAALATVGLASSIASPRASAGGNAGAEAAGGTGAKPGPTLIGVAGTVTSLAAMAQNLRSYDPTQVHGFALTRQALATQMTRLYGSTQSEREAMAGLDPRRADVILAGALILQGILTESAAPAVLVSDRGIRWGLLYEQLQA